MEKQDLVPARVSPSPPSNLTNQSLCGMIRMMEEDKMLSVDEFFEANGRDFFVTEVEETATPAYLEGFTVEELE